MCRAKNKVVVEYALRHLKRPIGVAGWETKLVEELPKALEGSLPTVEQIEAELSDDLRTKPRARRRKLWSPDEFAALAAAGESESLELLEIISTGDPHFSLTTEALFREHQSKPRNPMIARLTREAEQEPPTGSLRPCAAVVTFGFATATTTGTPGTLPGDAGKAIGKVTGIMTGKTPMAVLRLLARGSEAACFRSARASEEIGTHHPPHHPHAT